MIIVNLKIAAFLVAPELLLTTVVSPPATLRYHRRRTSGFSTGVDVIDTISKVIEKLLLLRDLKHKVRDGRIDAIFKPAFDAMRTAHESYCELFSAALDAFRDETKIKDIVVEIGKLRRKDAPLRHELMGVTASLCAQRDLREFHPFFLAVHRYFSFRPDFVPRTRLSMPRDFVSMLERMEEELESTHGIDSIELSQRRTDFAKAIERLLLELESRWKEISGAYATALMQSHS